MRAPFATQAAGLAVVRCRTAALPVAASTIPSPTMFSDQLIDGIAEAVVWSADPTARSTAISSHGSNGQYEELPPPSSGGGAPTTEPG